jgi:hypothetical protein
MVVNLALLDYLNMYRVNLYLFHRVTGVKHF